MTVFESMMVMLTFGVLIVSILVREKIITLEPDQRFG